MRFSRVAFYSPDLKYAGIPQGNTTVVERLSDGKQWTLPTQGERLLWGPGAQVAYTISAQSGNYDRRIGRVYITTLGKTPRAVATVYGGGAVAWLDASTLLVSGKANALIRDRQLFTLNTQTGARRVLVTALNPRGVQPSPDGKWVAYSVTFDSAGRNGMFVQPTSGGAARKLDWFGSYQWRDAQNLVYIPLTLSVPTHTVRQYDLKQHPVTSPAGPGGQGAVGPVAGLTGRGEGGVPAGGGRQYLRHDVAMTAICSGKT